MRGRRRLSNTEVAGGSSVVFYKAKNAGTEIMYRPPCIYKSSNIPSHFSCSVLPPGFQWARQPSQHTLGSHTLLTYKIVKMYHYKFSLIVQLLLSTSGALAVDYSQLAIRWCLDHPAAAGG